MTHDAQKLNQVSGRSTALESKDAMIIRTNADAPAMCKAAYTRTVASSWLAKTAKGYENLSNIDSWNTYSQSFDDRELQGLSQETIYARRTKLIRRNQS